MTSGAKLTEGATCLIEEMRVQKADDDSNKRVRLAVFQVQNGQIDVTQKVCEEELRDKDVFEEYKKLLEPKACRFIMYDCHYDTCECGKREELVFTMWAPEDAPIKEKMCLASSKDAFKTQLNGVKHNLQMNDLSDCGDKDAFAEKVGKGSGVTRLEGRDVAHHHPHGHHHHHHGQHQQQNMQFMQQERR